RPYGAYPKHRTSLLQRLRSSGAVGHNSQSNGSFLHPKTPYSIHTNCVKAPLAATSQTSTLTHFLPLMAAVKLKDWLPKAWFSSNGHGSRRYNWRIVSVEETDLVEEVFCATVDGTHSFVLEDNILTGNCSVWSTRYMTKDDPSYPFVKLANNSFLGVGVGFDT